MRNVKMFCKLTTYYQRVSKFIFTVIENSVYRRKWYPITIPKILFHLFRWILNNKSTSYWVICAQWISKHHFWNMQNIFLFILSYGNKIILTWLETCKEKHKTEKKFCIGQILMLLSKVVSYLYYFWNIEFN